MGRRDTQGMSNAEIDAKLTRLVINCERESRQAIKQAVAVYAIRLKMNAPRDPDSTNNSADHIVTTNVKIENGRPQADVGFAIKGYKYGWYMHFPDGGTVVRGTMGQPAQDFMKKTDQETERVIQRIMRKAIEKGFDKL